LNDKEDEILKWWLTYHGHIGHEIWLITQDLSLVATGYKSVAEFFYKAIPASKRLFIKKFRYTQYASYKMYQKDFVSSFNIPMVDEVFALYHSGSLGNQKSMVHKFIKFAILLFFILLLIFFFFLKNFKSSPDPAVQKISEVKASESLKINIEQKYYIFEMNCIKNDCYINGSKEIYNMKIMQFFLKTYEPLEVSTISTYKGGRKFTYIFSEDVSKFFIKDVSDEKSMFNRSIN
ncbi:MAG: zonular occludens toxin domain-containing protein, partial [Campylobacter sp.]|nr:zonular occludens toxin domain-containing protein [Campylobacter sp.]